MKPILRAAQGVDDWFVEDLCSSQWFTVFGTVPSVDLVRECGYLVKQKWLRKLASLAAAHPYMSKEHAIGELHLEVARFMRPSEIRA